LKAGEVGAAPAAPAVSADPAAPPAEAPAEAPAELPGEALV